MHKYFHILKICVSVVAVWQHTSCLNFCVTNARALCTSLQFISQACQVSHSLQTVRPAWIMSVYGHSYVVLALRHRDRPAANFWLGQHINFPNNYCLIWNDCSFDRTVEILLNILLKETLGAVHKKTSAVRWVSSAGEVGS